MSEQWQGDWMHDRETGELIDGPALSRYQMFMLIRELRAVIHAHAETIRDKDAVIEEQKARSGVLEGALTLCEHKIGQHLQGQYRDGAALCAALAFAHASLAETEPKP